MPESTREERTVASTSTSASATQGGGVASSRGGPSRTDLRGASFAAGEAMLAPEAGAPVQRQEHGAGTSVGAAPASDIGAGTAVGEAMPAQVDLRQARVGFTLPANKVLSGSWKYEARTEYATQVELAVTPSGLRISTSPSLHFDVQWPGQNMSLYSAGVDFASGQSFAEFGLEHGAGSGVFDVRDTGQTVLRGMIDRAIAGTPMARPGYNPMNDQQLISTLTRIKANFDALPTGGGGAPVTPGEVSRPRVGATLAMRTPFERAAGGAGLRIPSGGSFDVDIQGTGNLSTILAAGGTGEAAAIAAGIQQIDIRSEAIQLIKGTEAVAKLQSLRVNRGGTVTLGRFEMMGSLGTGAGIESLIRLFAGAAQLAGQGVPPEIGLEATARSGAAEPTLVAGLSRSMIEEGLTAAVQGLFRENRSAVPGLDLARVFGVS